MPVPNKTNVEGSGVAAALSVNRGRFLSLELLVTEDPLPFQFCILLIRQADVVAAPASCANAALKLWHVLRVAAHNEGPQTVQCGEAIASGLRTDRGSAIGLKEANPPQTIVAIEVHQDAGMSTIESPQSGKLRDRPLLD